MAQMLFNDALPKMEVSNFSLMTICACGIVMLSVYFAEEYIRKPSKTSSNLTENIIRLPDVLQPVVSVFIEKKSDDKQYRKPALEQSYVLFLVYNIIYFLAMFVTVVVMKKYPILLLCVQHIAIVIVIGFYFLQFARPTVAIPCAAVYTLVWFLSVNTSYRWMINNTIVIMCVLMTGYVQFRNFLYLQIFMWLAFVYDVYMLGGVNIASTFQFFSYTDKPLINPVEPVLDIQAVTDSCQTLLCSIFSHDKSFKIPTVFSVQFGNPIDYVYIGSGDIMIGALVANFSLTFFKKVKYMLFTVLCFGVSVALLSQVTRTPFPALLSIVPICTIAIMLSGLCSRRWLELLVDNKDHHPKSKVIIQKNVDYLDV